MGNEQVPDHGLKGFGVRGDVFRIDDRDDYASRRFAGSVAPVPTNNPDDRCSDSLCQLDGSDQVRADIFFYVSPPNGENQ